jgi:hypothetical protein
MNPRSLANLKAPVQKGEVRNPTGENGRKRPYTQALEKVSGEPLPEFLRIAMNNTIRGQVLRAIGAPYKLKGIPDLYASGITWAEASAVRRNLGSVLEGDVREAVECREAIEGRATQRIEFANKNSRLLDLIASMPKPEPKSPGPASGKTKT